MSIDELLGIARPGTLATSLRDLASRYEALRVEVDALRTERVSATKQRELRELVERSRLRAIGDAAAAQKKADQPQRKPRVA